jgi:hypothetical protein
MADKTFPEPIRPRPPIGFPEEAPAGFAVHEELTRFQLAAKWLVRKMFRR